MIRMSRQLREIFCPLSESSGCTEEFLVPSIDPGKQWCKCDPELQPVVKWRRKKKED